MSDKNANYCCMGDHLHAAADVKTKLQNSDTIANMSEVFKIMSDPTRLKIINALMWSEMCVCDISDLLKLTQPTISHHLKAMRQTRLVKYRRAGKSIFYSLDDEHVKQLFDLCAAHISES